MCGIQQRKAYVSLYRLEPRWNTQRPLAFTTVFLKIEPRLARHPAPAGCVRKEGKAGWAGMTPPWGRRAVVLKVWSGFPHGSRKASRGVRNFSLKCYHLFLEYFKLLFLEVISLFSVVFFLPYIFFPQESLKNLIAQIFQCFSHHWH